MGQDLGALRTALGSMRETMSCLEVAHAFECIGANDVQLSVTINRITGTLVRLVEGPH